MAAHMFTRDSITEARIQKEMELQHLFGKKEAIETHISLSEDSEVINKLQNILDNINKRITEYQSVDP
ncbi:MAG TPA: hypothetical protein VMW53_03840 [archaeon]|jgi:hypothetical protein|nr:hypothetical protein [archaeon]